MLKKLSIKGRMFLIIGAIFMLFVTMLSFAINNSNAVLQLGITETGEVMLEDQKAKLKIANHTIAIALGHTIEGMDDENEQIETIRKLIKHAAPKQEEFDFLVEHPIIRNLSDYGDIVRVDFRKENVSS